MRSLGRHRAAGGYDARCVQPQPDCQIHNTWTRDHREYDRRVVAAISLNQRWRAHIKHIEFGHRMATLTVQVRTGRYLYDETALQFATGARNPSTATARKIWTHLGTGFNNTQEASDAHGCRR